MSDAQGVHELVHPRPRTVDHVKLVLLTVGMVTVTSLATWATVRAIGAPPLPAPLIPTVTFVALLDRADLSAIPQGTHSRAFLAGVAAMLYLAGALSISA